MKSIFLSLVMLCSVFGFGQNGTIKGLILDENSAPVDFVNIILYAVEDTSIAKVEYSNEQGQYTLQGIVPGEYWITANFVGYADVNSAVFTLKANESINVPALQFGSSENQLEEVTITAQRPLLELKPNKVVMNVAGSINASGTDAFSLLRKSPGVMVDNNDNISMLGKSGVQIYINGKPSQLEGDQLTNYLRSLSSSEIDAIEIISNPSVKFDAEGSGGIINIKLNKNMKHGAKGNYEASISQGKKTRLGNSLTGNFRNEKWHIYGNTGYYKGQNFNINDFERVQFGNQLKQDNYGEGEWNTLSVRTGIDYTIDEQNTIGAIFSLSDDHGAWNNSGSSILSQLQSSIPDSILVSEANDDWTNDNWNGNLNYSFENKAGTSLGIDLDYGSYSNMREEYQPNTYFSADTSQMLSQRIFYSQSPTNIDIATAKLDFGTELLSTKLEMGAKYSKVKTDNVFEFYNVINEENIIDPDRSNDFVYDESVAAAYLNLSRKFGKLNFQSGLRIEQTDSKGQLTAMNPTQNQSVERNYLDFFPSLALSYQLDEKNGLNLSYSRRLNRPNYQDLNPFKDRIDEITFQQGNPFLNPEYSNNISLSHSWNYKINTTLNYNHTTDLITRMVDVENEMAAFITWRNLAEQKSFSLNISSPIPVTEWWNSYTSVTAYRTQNKADFGESRTVDLSANAFNIYSQHSFKLPKDIGMEISGWYNSSAIWEGTFLFEPMYAVDIGFQKKFLDDKLNVKLGVDDVFRTQVWKGNSVFGDLDITASGRGDSRRVKLSVSYSFGNSQIKAKQHKTGLEDEANRIKSDN